MNDEEGYENGDQEEADELDLCNRIIIARAELSYAQSILKQTKEMKLPISPYPAFFGDAKLREQLRIYGHTFDPAICKQQCRYQ